MLRLQKAVLATGMFSLFEALLQDKYGWEYPYSSLDQKLRELGRTDLADPIKDYNLSINVLKYGTGRSHAELMARKETLPFRISVPGHAFDEGDVSEIGILIDVDDRFVRRCAELIDQATAIIGT
jgi:hypothetical protein